MKKSLETELVLITYVYGIKLLGVSAACNWIKLVPAFYGVMADSNCVWYAAETL